MPQPRPTPPVIRLEDIVALADEIGVGFCLSCGVQADGCDPDTRNAPCEACGKPMVFGLEEVLISGLVSQTTAAVSLVRHPR
jgi:hypothetical protein